MEIYKIASSNGHSSIFIANGLLDAVQMFRELFGITNFLETINVKEQPAKYILNFSQIGSFDVEVKEIKPGYIG